MIFGKSRERREEILYSWAPWFAWYPVLLKDGRMVWLETVERKHNGTDDYFGTPWEYRSIRSAREREKGGWEE